MISSNVVCLIRARDEVSNLISQPILQSEEVETAVEDTARNGAVGAGIGRQLIGARRKLRLALAHCQVLYVYKRQGGREGEEEQDLYIYGSNYVYVYAGDYM